MNLDLHPDLRLCQLAIGAERAPLLVIENFVANAEALVSTDLFEQIAKQDGAFNRMLVYRRNSLHSGCIESGFVPDPNPSTGRLSINSFIDWAPT